jgi:hypothetical protein
MCIITIPGQRFLLFLSKGKYLAGSDQQQPLIPKTKHYERGDRNDWLNSAVKRNTAETNPGEK